MGTVPRKENKNIEFKGKLSSQIHLKDDKKQHLAAQMKYLMEVGNGTAIYIVGVDNNGKPVKLSEIELEETLNVLKAIALENNAKIAKVEKFIDNGNLIGRIVINRNVRAGIKNHIVIGMAGHVHSGKSTLIGTLITGRPDKEGKNWLILNVLPHEIERGLTADLHYTFLGFKNGKPLYFKNPLDKREKSKLVEISDKIISFVDNVGHEGWFYSSVRGLVGQNIDYGILTVGCDDGVTHITKEHLGLLLAMNLPIIVCITKIDKVGEKRISEVKEQIEEMLKFVGKVPFEIKDENDVSVILDKLEVTVPIIKTSALSLEGYNLLNKLLFSLPERKREAEKPFLMFIDKVYDVKGVGTVVSGTVKQGKLRPGSKLLLGPFGNNFKEVVARSIEMHYCPLEEANAGLVVGIAIKGVRNEEVERGMVLCDKAIEPRAVKSFEAEVLILNHPTRIATNYEPVLHSNTIAESVKFELLDKEYLKAGDTGKVRISFKYKPCFVQEGDKFVFREGKTKGIGSITKILKFA